MAIPSLLRSRRLQSRRAEVTRQLIVFQLQQEWFALPIEVVQRVVPLGSVHGDPKRRGIGLTTYQDQELVVIDIGQRLFGEPTVTTPASSQQPRYLIVVQTPAGLIGVPIDSQPSLQRVPESSFSHLPAAYVTEGNIQCLSSMLIQDTEKSAIFMLDPSQLPQSPQLVAPAQPQSRLLPQRESP